MVWRDGKRMGGGGDCHLTRRPNWCMGWCCRCGIWSRNYLVGESLESAPPSPNFLAIFLYRHHYASHVHRPPTCSPLTRNSDEAFTSYRTAQYKLHLYETLTGYRFVLLSDPSADSLRFVLRQLYTGPFVDYVVRNPLIEMDSRTHGIDNDQVSDGHTSIPDRTAPSRGRSTYAGPINVRTMRPVNAFLTYHCTQHGTAYNCNPATPSVR